MMEFRPNSQHLPVTRAAVLQLAAGALERLGLPPKSYASRARVPLRWLDCDPEALIPIARVHRLFEEAGRDVDGFGAIAGEVPVEASGRFGRVVRGGLTVLDALERSLAFAPDLGRVHAARLIRDPKTGGFWFARLPSKLVDGFAPQDELLVLRFMIRIAQLATGPDWKPEALRFCSVEEATRALESVPAFRGVRAETGASSCGVLFPREALGLLLPEMDCGALDDLDRWQDEGPAGSLVASLRQLLLSALRANQTVGIFSVAESVGVHPRTMQRRLARDGVSYRDVLDQARYVRARELINRDRDVSLTEIAYELGYSDLAAFSRAFRRWSGEPPSALRLRLELVN
jgi:AraC-like DNA-binding protein